MLTLSQKWPKLLYFYVHTQSINISLNITNVLNSKSIISSTSEAGVNVLGYCHKEATPHLSLILDM